MPRRPEPATRPLMTIGANWFFTVGAVVLVLGILATGGVFGYVAYMNRVRNQEIAIVQEREENLKTKGSLNEVTAFSQSFAAAQNLLQSHTFPTNFFRFLSATTHTSVQFKSLTFNGAAGKADLSGVARSYRTVAEQVTLFEASPHVGAVTFGGLALEPSGLVSFTITLMLEPSAYGYREQ